jgi:hypothetical protein
MAVPQGSRRPEQVSRQTRTLLASVCFQGPSLFGTAELRKVCVRQAFAPTGGAPPIPSAVHHDAFRGLVAGDAAGGEPGFRTVAFRHRGATESVRPARRCLPRWLPGTPRGAGRLAVAARGRRAGPAAAKADLKFDAWLTSPMGDCHRSSNFTEELAPAPASSLSNWRLRWKGWQVRKNQRRRQGREARRRLIRRTAVG